MPVVVLQIVLPLYDLFTSILVIIFLLGITYFIHENRESSTVPLPATGSEEIIVSDDPIDPDTHHTYTPQTEEP